MTMTRAVYPGTFDPITNGHEDLIQRASRLFGEVVVGVAHSQAKRPFFSLDERVSLAREVLSPYSNVSVLGFKGLLSEFVKEQSASVILRGLRAVSDFEYEIQMANMNARMEPNIETIFLMASDRHQFIASSLVKDIARLGGDTSQFVSKKVFQRLKDKFKKS
jgi:pantetheine-phosphate adenylyltransferase